MDFNPRSREGSDSGIDVKYSISTYFNPRSREGSDEKLGDDDLNGEISIHAPARGATLESLVERLAPFRISIHAPARGATVRIACFMASW